jgi:HEAT repeat protein
VTVQPLFNRLNLVVNGEIDSSQRGTDEQVAVESSHAEGREEAPARSERAVRPVRETRSVVMDVPPPVTQRTTSTIATSSAPLSAATAAPLAPPPPSASNAAPANAPATKATSPTVLIPLQEDAPASGATTVPAPAASPSPDPAAEESQPGILARIFSGAGVAILLALGIITLFVIRLRRPKEFEEAKKAVEISKEVEEETTALAVVPSQALSTTAVSVSADERRREQRRKGERKWWGRRSSDLPARLSKAGAATSQTAEPHEARADARSLVHAPTAMFGAYRVDQEVGKLLLGQPHRMDVLASRAPDDRRAVENSLIKALHAPEADMESRRRALEALEDYGFVARLSASLLLAPEAYERAAAARTLGELEALSSLPFLLEALYDAEPIVRTQAVTTLGTLKQPAAIGALLDMARRHPEMPASLLSRVLSACSLDCLDFGEPPAIEAEMLSVNNASHGPFTGEITKLETSTLVEELPEWLEDEQLTEALAHVESTDAEARKTAARQLAQFQVQRAVHALSQMAANDLEPSARAAAIASLADINHESVFASVLMAFADEAREVRAAAARALSHLSFDRADAYVRLLETSSPDKLREVAQACIKGGMAAQAIERLASTDRRQAYESFALLSILAKSNETQPILDAITKHTDYNVRLSAVRLLGLSGQPEVVQQIRHLAVKDGLPEKLRTALLEVVYKIDQALPV